MIGKELKSEISCEVGVVVATCSTFSLKLSANLRIADSSRLNSRWLASHFTTSFGVCRSTSAQPEDKVHTHTKQHNCWLGMNAHNSKILSSHVITVRHLTRLICLEIKELLFWHFFPLQHRWRKNKPNPCVENMHVSTELLTQSIIEPYYDFVPRTWLKEFKPIYLPKSKFPAAIIFLNFQPDVVLFPRRDPKCRSDPDHAVSAQSEGLGLDQIPCELRALGGRGGVPYIRKRENWCWRTGKVFFFLNELRNRWILVFLCMF